MARNGHRATMSAPKQWGVQFEVRHEFPSPGAPEAVVNLHQDLGDHVIDIRHARGVLAIHLRVAAQSKEDAEQGATKILMPVLRHSGIGDFAITRIDVKEIDSRP